MFRQATPQIDNIWLRRNNFTRLEFAKEFPVEFECRLCGSYANFRECERCSKRYYRPIRCVTEDSILITWVKFV